MLITTFTCHNNDVDSIKSHDRDVQVNILISLIHLALCECSRFRYMLFSPTPNKIEFSDHKSFCALVLALAREVLLLLFLDLSVNLGALGGLVAVQLGLRLLLVS